MPSFLPNLSNFNWVPLFFAVAIMILVLFTLVWVYRHRDHPLIQNGIEKIKRDIQKDSIGNSQIMKTFFSTEDGGESLIRQATSTEGQITQMLKTNLTLNSYQKNSLIHELDAVIKNMKRVASQIQQVQRLKDQKVEQNQLNRIEFMLQTRLEQSLACVQEAFISLIKVEVNSVSNHTDRVVQNLGSINKEMEDISEVQAAIKNLSS